MPLIARFVTVPGLVAVAVTVMLAVPFLPSLVAVTVAVPAAVAVTSPLLPTVATAGLLDDQVTVRPVRMFPTESFTVVVNCCVAATGMVTLAGLKLMPATGVGAGAAVVVLATFESTPNTAFLLRVPRNARTCS